MSEQKARQSLENLANALERLEEGLGEPKGSFYLPDAIIQRFEFVFELTWKTVKRFLAQEGVETATPKEALKAAYRAGWIQDEKT